MTDSGAKGVIVAPIVKLLRRWIKEHPTEQLPDALLDVDKARFLGFDRVLATEWYDLDTYHRLIAATHRTVFGGTDAGAVMMGVGAAQASLTGVYRVFLIEKDPVRTLSASPRMWAAHYRGSTAEVEFTDHGAVVSIRNYPMPPLMQQINIAWLEACVRMAGASKTRSVGRLVGADVIVDMTWTPPG